MVNNKTTMNYSAQQDGGRKERATSKKLDYMYMIYQHL